MSPRRRSHSPREYAYSHSVVALIHFLGLQAHSITKQVHDHYLPLLLHHDPANITTEQEITARNRLFNIDGFGVAYYTPTLTAFNIDPADDGQLRPALYKNAQPPLHDTNFRSLCANTSSTAVFAHIRAATATPITSVNNHPFVFGRHTFMHNGVVADFLSISRDLVALLDEDSYANIHGSTDSEHVAALYITYLTGGKGEASWEIQYSPEEMRDAMKKAIGTIISLQKKHLGPKAQPNSLNLCATDGNQLVAFRVRNHATEQPPSLYWSTSAGVTLNRKFPDHPDGKENPKAYKQEEEHGKHVIVASEPTTYNTEEWKLIEKNWCVLVGKEGEGRVEDIEIQAAWDSNYDPTA